MDRRQMLSGLTGVAIGAAALSLADGPTCGQEGSDIHARCARACADCMAACEACTHHCISMLAAGVKGHDQTLQVSADCGEICATAAKIVSRQGPLMAAICEACAKACDACAAACGKYPNMKPMQECIKATKQCAKLCREMLSSHHA